MKYAKAMLASALVVISGAAFAQAGGNGNGGGSGSGGSGNAHGAATAGPTAGGDPASGAMSSTKTHHMSKSKTKKPMNDTTNTPGADASSDTKGQ